jgi:hypothetical protein
MRKGNYGVKFISKIILGGLVASFAASAPVLADQQELQLGYVFNSWTSNFVFHGNEHRVPASYRLSSSNFNLNLNTAFVLGDYKADASPGNPVANGFNSAQLSDTSIGISVGLPMEETLKSFITASLNIPTGDPKWEGQAQVGAIPVIFEPGFYKGRGWGGNFFYGFTHTGSELQWGLAAGYLMTTTYDVGISAPSNFNPGDSLVIVGNIGGTLSRTENLGVRLSHSFAFESKVSDPDAKFAAGDSTILAGQWMKKMGSDKLAFNLSYSFYGRGYSVDPMTHVLTKDDQIFLGDRVDANTYLAYAIDSGVVFESGLVWKKILQNGYAETTDQFQGGGNLFGFEQSATFDMDSNTFLNFAGLYHFIINDKAHENSTEVYYHRFSIGTNVGFKL